MEEEKEVVQEEVVLEDAPQEEVVEEDPKVLNKRGLTAFILACIALFVLLPIAAVCFAFGFLPYIGWLLAPVSGLVTLVCNIAAIVLSGIALKMAGKSKAITANPFKIFRLLATIFGAVGLAFSIIALVLQLLIALLVICFIAVVLVITVIYLAIVIIMYIIGLIGAAISGSLSLLML